MALQDDYEVRLSSFQGPLDLLLFLVRRSEVDISDIPISMITEQYFGFLKNIHRVDVELAGEFLVMAATLVEIKSRTLAPRAPSQIDTTGENRREAADPRFELVQQLLAYQQFRTAAGALDRLRLESARRYVAGSHGGGMIPDTDENEFSVEIEDAHVLDLVESFERIMQSVDISRLGDHRIEYDDTPISLHQADLDCHFNLIDVRDAADGLVRAMHRGRPGVRYLIGGHNTRLVHWLELLATMTNRPMPRRRVPYALALTAGWFSELWADTVSHRMPMATVTGVRLTKRTMSFDPSASLKELGLQTRSVEESTRDAVNWYRQEGWI